MLLFRSLITLVARGQGSGTVRRGPTLKLGGPSSEQWRSVVLPNFHFKIGQGEPGPVFPTVLRGLTCVLMKLLFKTPCRFLTERRCPSLTTVVPRGWVLTVVRLRLVLTVARRRLLRKTLLVPVLMFLFLTVIIILGPAFQTGRRKLIWLVFPFRERRVTPWVGSRRFRLLGYGVTPGRVSWWGQRRPTWRGLNRRDWQLPRVTVMPNLLGPTLMVTRGWVSLMVHPILTLIAVSPRDGRCRRFWFKPRFLCLIWVIKRGRVLLKGRVGLVRRLEKVIFIEVRPILELQKRDNRFMVC